MFPLAEEEEEEEEQADDQVEDALSRYSAGQDKDAEEEELDDIKDAQNFKAEAILSRSIPFSISIF